jgi:hypothetical protein
MISQRRTLWRRLEWCRCWTTSSCIATEATRGAASLRGRAVMVSETISCDCPVSGSLLWKAFCAKALTRSWRRARVAGTRTADLHAVTVVRRFEAFGPISRDSGPGRSLGRGSGGKHRKYRDSCNHFHPDNSQHSSAPSAPMPMLAKLRGGARVRIGCCAQHWNIIRVPARDCPWQTFQAHLQTAPNHASPERTTPHPKLLTCGPLTTWRPSLREGLAASPSASSVRAAIASSRLPRKMPLPHRRSHPPEGRAHR